jgi:aldehyde dehydrogenase (NAD+)
MNSIKRKMNLGKKSQIESNNRQQRNIILQEKCNTQQGQDMVFELCPGAYGSKEYTVQDTKILECISPIDFSYVGSVKTVSEKIYKQVVNDARAAFLVWREVPAPKRGDLVRLVAEKLRNEKKNIAELITLETGKISSEALGEVQEAVDIADYAVGLSRKLYGYTMHSERPRHRMFEQWHPLGVIGVITAFNFPVAVWAWNAMLAAVCGDTVVWKPSPLTPLSAVYVTKLVREVLKQEGYPEAIFSLVVGHGKNISEAMAEDPLISLVSATGSTEMGRSVGVKTQQRFGKVLLELGGNNAVIVLNDADLDLALKSTVFGAVGTAGQRCTTTRRLYLQKGIYDKFVKKLISAYKTITIGDPRHPQTLLGPLISEHAVKTFFNAIQKAKKEGGDILYGGESVPYRKLNLIKNANDKKQRTIKFKNPESKMQAKKIKNYSLYVTPALVAFNSRKQIPNAQSILCTETFAPLLYIVKVNTLQEAIKHNNSVPQGLSSALFTQSVTAAEEFLSACGSDCGIANVNLGTSGAEIGGAFGGEKETGGGRESGSDVWKTYMRRQTSTINWSGSSVLAQGVKFS